MLGMRLPRSEYHAVDRSPAGGGLRPPCLKPQPKGRRLIVLFSYRSRMITVQVSFEPVLNSCHPPRLRISSAAATASLKV
jgi:hypothetical protein